MLTVLKETHRAERLLARNTEEKLLCVVFLALITAVFHCLYNKLLYRAAAYEVSFTYLSSAIWTPCIVLHRFVKAMQAVQALNGIALWTHPDFIRYQVKTHYAMTKVVQLLVRHNYILSG